MCIGETNRERRYRADAYETPTTIMNSEIPNEEVRTFA